MSQTELQMIPAWKDGTLVPMEKLAVHQQGIRHKAVSVFVMSNDQLLIQRRALGKYHTPGLWANTCCTHPLWDEDPRDCAIRRLDQELGVQGLSPDYRGQVQYRADVGGGLIEDELVDVFVAQANMDVEIDPNPDEVMAHRWVSVDVLTAEIADKPDQFTPWLRIYMAEHWDQILGDSV